MQPNGHRLDPDVTALVDAAVGRAGLVTVLTGAGISAASGIPTFRGPEGYWTIGAREYTPQQMATRAMFTRAPEEVWGWYRYRLGVCRAVEPNVAHRAIVDLERALGDRFLLITQNVDGLHLRARTTPARTYAVHGEIEWVRCVRACTDERLPVPDVATGRRRDGTLTTDERRALTCARCGAWLRPHVLWFDEFYDEPLFRVDSALRAAAVTSLLVTVGTSGATTHASDRRRAGPGRGGNGPRRLTCIASRRGHQGSTRDEEHQWHGPSTRGPRATSCRRSVGCCPARPAMATGSVAGGRRVARRLDAARAPARACCAACLADRRGGVPPPVSPTGPAGRPPRS
jgi:NAD-dependent deacetylase